VLDNALLIPKLYKRDMDSIKAVLEMPDLSDDKALKTAIYKQGRTAVAQALMIEIALERVDQVAAPHIFKIIQEWDVPMFPITGHDLIKEGFKPGPELGAELARREAEWIEACFS